MGLHQNEEFWSYEKWRKKLGIDFVDKKKRVTNLPWIVSHTDSLYKEDLPSPPSPEQMVDLELVHNYPCIKMV